MTTTLERDADDAAGRRDFAAASAILAQVTALDPGRIEPWLKLAGMRRATADVPGALAAADGALAVDPLHPTALLLRATLLERLADRRAGEAFGRAIAQAGDPPPPELAAVLAHARQRYAAWQADEAQRLRARVASAVGGVSAAHDRFVTNTVRLTTPDHAGATHYSYPGLERHAFWPRDAFPWIERVEARTEAIARECSELLAAREAQRVPYVRYPAGVPLDQWHALNHNDDWTAIHLLDRGARVAVNADRCPATLALLSELPQPDMPGAGPNAMFSLLAPGTHIPPHTGVADTRLVCHLPLITPPGCWFRVGSEQRTWRVGEAFVFDDTIEHEAMNPSDAVRIVLIFDIWHPGLSDTDRRAVTAVIGGGTALHRL